MKKYLENYKFYVQDDDKKIYEVGSFEVYDGYKSIHLNLELVAGWDYVNPDYNDIQGYVPADRFIDDVQCETVIQYFLEESATEALESDGYYIITLPESVQKIIDERKEA